MFFLLPAWDRKFTFTRLDGFFFYSSFWFSLDLLHHLPNMIFCLLGYMLHWQDCLLPQILSALFFMEFEKTKPSSLNLAMHFLFFSNMFWNLWCFFISVGLVCTLSSKHCCLCTKMKLISTISLFLFLPILVGWKLYIFCHSANFCYLKV